MELSFDLFEGPVVKRLRWKKDYSSGIAEVDERKRALFDTLNGLRTEMDRVEHCQDFVDLLDDLNTAATDLFEQRPPTSAALRQVADPVRALIETRLPLPARGTPACHECGLCDMAEARVKGWLADEGHQA